MNREFRAYLKVIDALLSCSHGDEEKVYQKFPHLVDTTLVIVMSLVVDGLESNGDPNVVDRLQQLRSVIAPPMAEWQDLNRQVSDFYDNGDIPAATALAEQALSIARKIFPSPNKDLATSLSNLGFFYELQGRTEEVEFLYIEALNIRRQLLNTEIEIDRDLAISLNNLASLYQSQGQIADAQPLYEEALGIYRQLLGGEANEKFTILLNNLATLYQFQERYNDAECLYQEAIEIGHQLCAGGVNRELGRSLNNLAELYKKQDRWVEAEPLYREAVDVHRQLSGNDLTIKLADLLNSLGNLYSLQGKWEKSKLSLEEALSIRRQLLGSEVDRNLASNLDSLAVLHDDRGEWQKAENLYQESLAIRHQLFGDEPHEDLSLSWYNLGCCYLTQGKWEEAEPLLEKSLNICRQLNSGISKRLASSLNALASLYRERGQWAKAEPLQEESIKIYQKLCGDEPSNELVAALNNLATLYYAQGRWREAEDLLLRVVNIRRALFGSEPSNALATNLNNLASLYSSQGRNEEAGSLYQESVRICRKLFGSSANQDLATSLNNLAGWYEFQPGGMADAEVLYLEVIDIYRQLFSDRPDRSLATALNNLAGLYLEQERWQEAEDLFLETLKIFRQLFAGREHQDLTSVLNNLAIFYTTTHRYPEALELFIEANQVQNLLLAEYFCYATPENQLILLEKMQSNLEELISLVWQHFPEDITAEAAALDAILKRKAASTISNSLLNAAQYNDRYPHLRDRFDRWQQLKQQIALGGDRLDETIRKQLEDECRQLYQNLAREVPEIKATSMDIDRQAIALYLPAHSVLVEFFRFKVYDFQASELLEKIKPARYIAFIITPDTDTPAELIDLGEADAIDELVQKYRYVANAKTLTMDDDDNSIPTISKENVETSSQSKLKIGSQLRAAILDPIFDRISTTDTLILAADGDLYRVPFATLPLDDTGNLVIDKYRVETLTAARDIRRRQETIERPAAAPLLVADPDYDYGVQPSNAELTPPAPELDRFPAMMGGKFKRLEMTSQLAHSIATRLKINPYLKRSATETLFHNQTRSPQYLIVATHGFADASLADRVTTTTDPMQRCGIALAGANGWLQRQPLPPDIGKGVLLAHDIAQLNLWGTEIVVLVACSTALGDTKSGQGIFGLRRALALAGAKHAIVSLWDVPARASMLLMNYFFDDYLASVSPSEALQQAQQQIRTITIADLKTSKLGRDIIAELTEIGRIDDRTPDTHQPLQSPYFWGAWICQG